MTGYGSPTPVRSAPARAAAPADRKSSKRAKVDFRCQECGYSAPKWVGRCPECQQWGTINEVGVRTTISGAVGVAPATAATRITDVDPLAARATETEIGELDRVLGVGIVPGSVILLAGEPGVGKSTLLLEVAKKWAEAGRTALYVTGEESAGQVRLRAERTGAVHENIFLAAEVDLATVIGHAEAVQPSLMIVDSVQTMVAVDATGVTGGVTQIRSVTTALTSLAKNSGIPIIMVGHVTKDGSVAGPRALEHLVDVVLSFEGERNTSLRMIRGIKNRFGATDEVGCFEQSEAGLVEVPDPSGLFLAHREAPVSGTAITISLDGNRALAAEVQALTSESTGPNPRRAVSGLDSARLSMMLAVLNHRSGMRFGKCDVFAATVGGMRLHEPAADLAVALALCSIETNRPLPAGLVVIGEVGLAGELRPVSGLTRRIAEAGRLGFRRVIAPSAGNSGGVTITKGVKLIQVGSLHEAITAAFAS